MSTEIITPEIVYDSALASTGEIAAINSFHRQANSAAAAARAKAEEAAHFAILAGIRLETLKSTLPHGEWGRLFRDRKSGNLTPNSAQIPNCAEFDFSQDTAARYIEVAKRIRLEQRLTSKAQKRLATIATDPEIDADSRDFLSRITEGRNLRQLYFDLEIITAKDKEAKEPKPAAPVIKKSQEQAMLEDAREFWFLWREKGEKLIRNGYLDALDKRGLEEMKEFQGWLRDRINARLNNL